MSPCLPTGAVKPENMAVGARQDIGADRAGNRRFGAVPVFLRLEIEQREGANDNGPQRRRLAVIDDVDALAGTGILLGAAMVATKGENLAHLIAWSIEQHMTGQQVLGNRCLRADFAARPMHR